MSILRRGVVIGTLAVAIGASMALLRRSAIQTIAGRTAKFDPRGFERSKYDRPRQHRWCGGSCGAHCRGRQQEEKTGSVVLEPLGASYAVVRLEKEVGT